MPKGNISFRTIWNGSPQGSNEVPKNEVNEVHDATLNQIKAKMPKEEILYDLSELFKVFGDSTRMKILNALMMEELCVCDVQIAHGFAVCTELTKEKIEEKNNAPSYTFS